MTRPTFPTSTPTIARAFYYFGFTGFRYAG